MAKSRQGKQSKQSLTIAEGRGEKAQLYSMFSELFKTVRWLGVTAIIVVGLVCLAPSLEKFAGKKSEVSIGLSATINAAMDLVTTFKLWGQKEPSGAAPVQRNSIQDTLFYDFINYSLWCIIFLGAWLGGSYGKWERRLRGKKVAQLSGRVDKLERQIDPKKQSSGLHATGQTNPEDSE